MTQKASYLLIILSVAVLSACSQKTGGNMQQPIAASELSDSLPEQGDLALAASFGVIPMLKLPTTEDQLAYMKGSRDWSKYETGILPRMAQDAPKYCEKVLQTRGKRFIIVDKGKMKLFLYDPYGNVELKYGIACAKNYGARRRSWDSRTAEGIFSVVEVCNSITWCFTDENGNKGNPGVYGPKFIRLNIPAIGIHGTSSPGSIGKRVSHGCVRVTNDNILELVKYVEEGMPVIITPGPQDRAVNESENHKVLAVATEI